jgi:tetratricopeptide (TPR) repeat protein
MQLSVAICVYNDFDFLAEGIDRIYDLADEIVILDGPYEYCKPILKYFDMYYEQPPQPLKALLARPKVRYEYRTFEDERRKRIALYEMCRGDVVMLLDSDELVTEIRRDNIAAFLASNKSVASARFHNHVRSNVLFTQDTRKLIFFKRAEVSAAAHLNYTWLVGVEQEKPNREIIFDRERPLLDVAHLTLMRSPYYSIVKYCFYTRLYFHSRGLADQIDKLFGRPFKAFADLGMPMETIRDIFRRSVTDSLNFPERETLRPAPPSAAVSPDYDKVADVAHLDEASEIALLNGVKSHYYVRIPTHLKAGDPFAFSFKSVNALGIEVEGVFHDGDRCETVAAQVRAGASGVWHGALKLPFDGGGRFGALIVFRPRCADPAVLARVSGFKVKKRFGFYGNCQTENVLDFLKSSDAFVRDWEVEPTPGRLAHMMSDDDIAAFHARAHRIDYLILQPISEGFRGERFGAAAILARLRPEARVFMTPNMFVTAYAPDSYCVTYRKSFMQKPMPIHDINFIYSHIKHHRDRAAVKADYLAKLRDPQFYSNAFVRQGVDKNIAELAAREKEGRQKYPRDNAKYYEYSKFVAAHYNETLLHYSDAHPTEFVFEALAREILADLGLPGELKPVGLKEKGVVPFYRAIGDRLGFDAERSPIYLNNRATDFDVYFDAYCNVYDRYDPDELFGYVSRNVTKIVVTNHKTGTMLMQGVLREYCKTHKLKLLELNQHLSANQNRIDVNVDFQSYEFIFITHAQHFEQLVDAAPNLRYRAIHLIRHPLEIIMSGVRYHQITDEVWCNRKIFVADASAAAGFRRIANYDASKDQERGEMTYREIMNSLDDRGRVAFEIRQHAAAFGTIPSIKRFLARFRDDGNVATLRLEDISAPECIAFVFKFLALDDDYLANYRAKVGETGWLGKHVTNRDGKATFAAHFDEPLLKLFEAELGAATIADFGYTEDSPAPVYFREPQSPLPPMETAAPPPAAAPSPAFPEKGTAEEFFAAGEKYLAAGEPLLAKRAYQRALEADARKIGALGRLGDICVKLGQHADALGYYRRIEALVANPPAWLYIGLGNALEALGERRAALDSLQQAVRLGFDSPAVLKRVERLAL